MRDVIKTEKIELVIKPYHEGYSFRGHAKDLHDEFVKTMARLAIAQSKAITDPKSYLEMYELQSRCNAIAEFYTRAKWKWNEENEMFVSPRDK